MLYHTESIQLVYNWISFGKIKKHLETWRKHASSDDKEYIPKRCVYLIKDTIKREKLW